MKGELSDWFIQTEVREYHNGYLQAREPRKLAAAYHKKSESQKEIPVM